MAQTPEQRRGNAGSTFAYAAEHVQRLIDDLEDLIVVDYGQQAGATVIPPDTDVVIPATALYVREESGLPVNKETTRIVGVVSKDGNHPVLAARTTIADGSEATTGITVFHANRPESFLAMVPEDKIAGFDPGIGYFEAPADTPTDEMGVRQRRTLGEVAAGALARFYAIGSTMLDGEQDPLRLLGY